MIKRAWLFTLLCFLPALAQLDSALPQDLSAELELLSVWIQERIDYYKIPGVAVGVVDEQKLIWAKGFGYSDVESKRPMTPETLCRIASLTKTFTATAIMQLRDQGKLRLDDPITRFLPWFQIKSRFAAEPPITIENLLTHTGGLPGEAAFPYWTDHRFPTAEQIRQTVPNQELIQAPWSTFHYSNLGLALAGQIVEAASGEPYETYVSKHILQPLRMNSTSVVLPAAQRSRLATSYDRLLPDGTRLRLAFPECEGLIPAANISSCVSDLAKYIALHLRYDDFSDSAVLAGPTLREMQRVHWLDSGWNSGRGLGFAVNKRNNRTLVGHSGWVAGYRSRITFCPAEKIGVVVLMNCADGDPTTIAYRTYELVAPLILRARPSPPEPAVDPASYAKYVGHYEDLTGWQLRVMMRNSRLVLYQHDYPPADDPEAGVIELTPEGENTFRMTGGNGNGELVRFIMNADQRVERLYKGENYYLWKR
ncbi:serine hydrolase [bacterium]|nr:serine hydrolase [bacterium]